MAPCPACGCASPDGDAAHRIVAALAVDDVDRAIDAGLLDDIACDALRARVPRHALAHARDARRRALAARERFRDRTLRLARRQRERDAKPRRPPAPPPRPPPAAAAALARAKARAAQRKPE